MPINGAAMRLSDVAVAVTLSRERMKMTTGQNTERLRSEGATPHQERLSKKDINADARDLTPPFTSSDSDPPEPVTWRADGARRGVNNGTDSEPLCGAMAMWTGSLGHDWSSARASLECMLRGQLRRRR